MIPPTLLREKVAITRPFFGYSTTTIRTEVRNRGLPASGIRTSLLARLLLHECAKVNSSTAAATTTILALRERTVITWIYSSKFLLEKEIDTVGQRLGTSMSMSAASATKKDMIVWLVLIHLLHQLDEKLYIKPLSPLKTAYLNGNWKGGLAHASMSAATSTPEFFHSPHSTVITQDDGEEFPDAHETSTCANFPLSQIRPSSSTNAAAVATTDVEGYILGTPPGRDILVAASEKGKFAERKPARKNILATSFEKGKDVVRKLVVPNSTTPKNGGSRSTTPASPTTMTASTHYMSTLSLAPQATLEKMSLPWSLSKTSNCPTTSMRINTSSTNSLESAIIFAQHARVEYAAATKVAKEAKEGYNGALRALRGLVEERVDEDGWWVVLELLRLVVSGEAEE